MFLKFLLTVFLAGQMAVPVNLEAGRVLGIQTQGDEATAEGPQRITNQNLDLVLSAGSAVAIDAETGKILYAKNIDQVRPIASLTKLVTALVFLDQQVDWNKQMSITWAEEAEGGRLYVRHGEKLSVKNLFYSSLIASTNNTALALARSTGLSKKEFARKMNKKALELGMRNTHFEEPTGLSEKNVSNAADLVLLAQHALTRPKIFEILSLRDYKFKTDKKEYKIKNTNLLLKNDFFKVEVGKTGFTDEAGYCLMTLANINGHQIITVVLGAPSANGRFQDTKALYWWVKENFKW